MTRTVLRNFAIYAREKLIEDTRVRASMMGITEDGIQPPLLESKSADELVFETGTAKPFAISGDEVRLYRALIDELEKRKKHSSHRVAYKELIEDIACTWFVRLVAIRFLEINNYLPKGIRALSSGRQEVEEPELVIRYFDAGLNLTDKEIGQLEEWKTKADPISMDRAFRLLLIKLCHELDQYFPILFDRTKAYPDLLLNVSYSDPEGVVYRLVHQIEEKHFDLESQGGEGNAEVVGWLYQYYNTRPRDRVIDVLSKTIVRKRDIPAATQVFTPDWVVRYMVDNSLGRYWLERNPDSPIRESLEYLMPGDIPIIQEEVSPEEIKVFDNAMGSGHCLSYAFDLLLMIYESRGYTAEEASRLIIEKNLYGLDIDKRTCGLARFILLMKARRHNERALDWGTKTNLTYFEDSSGIRKDCLNHFGLNMGPSRRERAQKEAAYLIDKFENAVEIGSLLRIDKIQEGLLLDFIHDCGEDGDIQMEGLGIREIQRRLGKLVKIASILTDRYHVMVTNPPYLNKPDRKLKDYIFKNYADYKGDLFSVFIYNNLRMCQRGGYSAYMSPFVWMFIRTHEGLRKHIIKSKSIVCLIQMEYSAFGEATVPLCTFVLQNSRAKGKGKYIKLTDFTGGMEVQRKKTLEAIKNPGVDYYYEVHQDTFERLPGMPIAYWANDSVIEAFLRGQPAGSLIEPKVGLQTGDNDRFLRLWYEVDVNKISFSSDSIESSIVSEAKWFPYNKGGRRRQWYGNYDYVVNWEKDGYEIRNFVDNNGKRRSALRNSKYYFKESITWSLVTSGGFSIRYREAGSIHDVSGMSAFTDDRQRLLYMLGLMGSKVSGHIFKMLNPTINLQVGNFSDFPVLFAHEERVVNLVLDNIRIAKEEWNSYEEAWGFREHPFLTHRKSGHIEDSFKAWKRVVGDRIERLKANEEELNRIFIERYGLEGELSPCLSEENITLRDADMGRDVRSFISYAVGCMFGRYSLDYKGLAFAGGEWDDRRYISFKPTSDNVLLITDRDYNIEDITHRFIEFVKVTFGEDSLEENLRFIARSLGLKGTPREVIREYFLKGFYRDHVKAYQKRPVYWLCDSGRQNGFKALIYIHRYDENLAETLRTKYLHRMMGIYRSIVEDLKEFMDKNKEQERAVQANRDIKKISAQIQECLDFDDKLEELAQMKIPMDLDHGVKENYNRIQMDAKGNNLGILARIN
jgi:hypothetical protein